MNRPVAAGRKPKFAIPIVASLLALAPCPARSAETWDPFPVTPIFNDFGGVGLIQTPTARMAPDGQVSFVADRIDPYERYTVTVQAMPWLEASLRYTAVGNRLFSDDPSFSGAQSFKDRGLDIKVRLATEGAIRPAIVFGARDFLGTGIFQAEYVVANKVVGPLDISFGMGWGQLGARETLRNPLTFLSRRFNRRGEVTALGGSFNAYYFSGRRVGLFGGVRYDTPIRGVTVLAEFDPNDYQSEALSNQFRSSLPINLSVNYQLKPWLQLGASFERGNRLGLRLAITGNIHRKPNIAKVDAPAPPILADGPTRELPPADVESVGLPAFTDRPVAANLTPTSNALGVAVENALAMQGAVLVGADFAETTPLLFVAQTRFLDPAQGLGRTARAAFSVLPMRYGAVTLVMIEGGVRTNAVTLYRHLLAATAGAAPRSTEILALKSTFSPPPSPSSTPLPPTYFLAAAGKSDPRLSFSVVPGLRTTLGRPEQFILYQAWLRIHGTLEFKPGLFVSGSYGLDLSNNFDNLRVRSDSILPHVRSDIDQYFKQGRTALTHLEADYSFNITPTIYGHVFAGMLEEMFGGAGGEVLWRPYGSNLALGADLSWVKQRNFKGEFGFQDYQTVTGFVTAAYHFENPAVTATVRAGRYLAKDYGATFELSRTFRSGATIGAFATATNISAAEFGEGRFDKGIYLTIPLDLLYNRHVRSSIGLLWRPLIRDGGQQLLIRNPLLGLTAVSTNANIRRNWQNIGK